MNRRIWVAILVALLAYPGGNRVLAQRYPFFNIGIEQGLIQSQVFALAQDNAGHLWAGTLGGLSCYDGQSFRSFTVRDGLASNSIHSLFCDWSGILWIGTSKGLSSYDGHSFTNYRFKETASNGGTAVTQIAVENDNSIWVVAGRLLYQLKDGMLALHHLPESHMLATSILPDKQGGFWLGTSAGSLLYRYQGKHWDSIALPKPAYVHRIYEDSKGRIILLTTEGLYRYDTKKWELLYALGNSQKNLLFSFAEAGDHSYWLSTSAEVIQISKKAVRQYSKQNGLTDILVVDILKDRENNLWFATNGEGLYRFSGARFTAVDERMGLAGPQVSSIARDARGVVYFGSYDGGLYRYDDKKVNPIPFPVYGSRPPVTSLVIYKEKMYIGTQGSGLWTYHLTTGILSQVGDGRIGRTIPSLIADNDGVWVTGGKNLLKIAKDTIHVLNTEIPPVESLIKIGEDSLLLSTRDGLMLLSNKWVRPFITGSSVDSGQVICLDFRAGVVWIGTIDDGVFGYDLQSHKTLHVNRSNGLRSNFIYSVYAAPDNKVWVGTGYGICCIKSEWDHPTVTFYGRNAGVIGMESNRNAVLPLEDGSIWFGTTGGALLYHPENAAAISRPISLQLQSLSVSGEPVGDTALFNGVSAIYQVPQSLRLPWRRNNLSFSFQAISLTGQERILYRYRLVGLNAPWSEWTTNRTVNFSALPPGEYALEVQCSTDGSKPQPPQLRYDFTIITPFHKTSLFKLLILIACILLGVSIQYIAARRKRARLAMMEELRREERAKIRERTAEDFHDEVGNKLTRINVLTNVLRSKISSAVPDASRIIDQIQDNANQLYSGTRDILWSLQPSNDTLYQVLRRIQEFGEDLFRDTEINFRMDGIDPAWRNTHLTMDVSRNLIMIFKEALNNALKYSKATHVTIICSALADELRLRLHDDGVGFDPKSINRGQGLGNIKTRAARLGADIDIETEFGQGTTIELSLKIPSNKG